MANPAANEFPRIPVEGAPGYFVRSLTFGEYVGLSGLEDGEKIVRTVELVTTDADGNRMLGDGEAAGLRADLGKRLFYAANKANAQDDESVEETAGN